ncbi:hypothetical protein J7K50_07910 [bacterium]|nr:hypothetical protein [bacterium]
MHRYYLTRHFVRTVFLWLVLFAFAPASSALAQEADDVEESANETAMSVDGLLGFRLGEATGAEALTTVLDKPETERSTYRLEENLVLYTFNVENWMGDLDLELPVEATCTLFVFKGIVAAFRMDIDFGSLDSSVREEFKAHFKSRLGWEPGVTRSENFHLLQWIDESEGICRFYELAGGRDIICWAIGDKARDRIKYLRLLNYADGVLEKPDWFPNDEILGFGDFILGSDIMTAQGEHGGYKFLGIRKERNGRFDALCFQSPSSPISTIKVDPEQGAFIFVLIGAGKIREISLVFLHGTYDPGQLEDTKLLYEQKYGAPLYNDAGLPYWIDLWNATEIEFKESSVFNWIEYSDLTYIDVSIIEVFGQGAVGMSADVDRI